MHVNVVHETLKKKKKLIFKKSTVGKLHSVAMVFVGLYSVKGNHLSQMKKKFQCDKIWNFIIYCKTK